MSIKESAIKNYPFTFFKTKKMVDADTLRKEANIFSLNELEKKSIFLSNTSIKYEIEELLKDDKTRRQIVESDIFKEISESYYDNGFVDMATFFRKIVSLKKILVESNKNMNAFITGIVENELLNLNDYKYSEFMSFVNPLNNITFDKKYFEKESIYLPYSTKKEDIERMKRGVNIFLYGGAFSASLPSIGPLCGAEESINSNININEIKETYHYVAFMKDIIRTIWSSSRTTENFEWFPLSTLNIGETIASILTRGTSHAFNNKNNSVKTIIVRMIEAIRINLEEIMTTKSRNNKKNEKTFKQDEKIMKREFIIPFKLSQKNKEEFVPMSEIEISRITKLTKGIDHNNMILSISFNKYNKKNGMIDDETHIKSILAWYIFYLINILTSLIREHINKINVCIQNIIVSNDERFKHLNVEETFNYTSLLNRSYFNFKLILFNNFYNLFLPNMSKHKNYGMKLYYGCYIPESSLLRDQFYLKQNYPFHIRVVDEKVVISFTSPSSESHFDKTMCAFLTKIPTRGDKYDASFRLEFGTTFLPNECYKNVLSILKKYYTGFIQNNKFNIFLLEKMVEIFQKKIPYETIAPILMKHKNLMLNSGINGESKTKLESELLNQLQLEINQAKYYYYELVEIQKIDKSNGGYKSEKQIITQLCFSYYQKRILCFEAICDKAIAKYDFKITMLDKIQKKIEELNKTLNKANKAIRNKSNKSNK